MTRLATRDQSCGLGAGRIETADGRGVVLNGGGINVSEGTNEYGAMLYYQSIHEGVRLKESAILGMTRRHI